MHWIVLSLELSDLNNYLKNDSDEGWKRMPETLKWKQIEQRGENRQKVWGGLRGGASSGRRLILWVFNRKLHTVCSSTCVFEPLCCGLRRKQLLDPISPSKGSPPSSSYLPTPLHHSLIFSSFLIFVIKSFSGWHVNDSPVQGHEQAQRVNHVAMAPLWPLSMGLNHWARCHLGPPCDSLAWDNTKIFWSWNFSLKPARIGVQ